MVTTPLLLLLLAVVCSASPSSSSLGVVRNILLPTNEPQLLPYLLDFSSPETQQVSNAPCWKLTTNSAAFSNAGDDDDSLVVVTPAASQQQQEEDCYVQFEISIRADSIKKSGLRSLVFENVLNPNEHRRVDVHANLLRALEIATTTRRLEIGEEQTLTVIGKDQFNNVFTSLKGLSFDFSFAGPKAAEHCQFVGPVVHNQIIVRGIKTGRSPIRVSLPNQISTQVELIVARTVSVCPGELVSLPHKPQLDMFQYCLAKKQGCYQSASKEFTWQVQGETEDGGFTLQVQDEAEPTNKAATRVTYSKFASLAHFVAPFPQPPYVVEDCAYVLARLDGKWPALSKHLPREPAFWKHLPHYYLWTHSTWVFMGLLKLENDQYAPLHMSLENFQFKMNDTSLLKFKENFHGTSVFQAEERTGTVRMTMQTEKHGQVDFLVTIMDRVDAKPNKLVLDLNCAARVRVTGGTGHYRTTSPTKYRILNSSLLELPAEQREGQFAVKVWDARWDLMDTSSPKTVVQYEVRKITRFALREGRKLFANVGETVRIHMVGSQAENCCAKQPQQQSVWKFDEKMLQRVPEEDAAAADVCAQAAFVAREVGVTEVSIAGLKIEVEVMNPLDFSPQSGVVLTLGCKQSVDVLNVNFAASKLTLDGAPLTQAKFDIACNAPGTYSHVISSITKLRTYTKTFTFECIRAASCALELMHGAQRITSTHVQLNLPNLQLVPTVWSEDGAKHTQHAKCWTSQYALNGTRFVHGENQVTLNQLGLATLTASLLELECKPLHINVALPFTLPMGNSVQFWADDCTEPEIPLLQGSGKFSSSMFTVRHRTLLISKHAKDTKYGAVVIRDEDFYPLVTRTLQVEFFKDFQLTMRAMTQHLVQHSSIEFAVSPTYLDFAHMDTQLSWEPKQAFDLESSEADRFKMFAWQSGQVHIDFSVASTCDKEHRVRVQQTFVIHPFRAVALLRGDTYQLSECDGERATSLVGCEIVSFTGAAAAFQVNATGAVVADCREQSQGKTALVHCMPNNQYFDLAMASIDQVRISPKHEHWMQHGAANQVHFELLRRDVPQHWPQDKLCRAGQVSANEWKIQVSNAGGTHKFTTKQDIVSVFVDKQSSLQVKATVQLGTKCTDIATQTVNAMQKYTVTALPTVSIGNHVLLPPGAQFEVQASEPVQCKFTCAEACTADNSIWLENCRINTARNAGVSSCSLSIFTPSNTEVAFFQSQVEVQPIASLSLSVKQEESLSVTFHDQYTREFTKGWVDGTTKRALFFQVPAPLHLILDSRVNCSKPLAGQDVAMHVRTGSVKHNVHHPASITVKLQGDDGLVLKASNLMKLQDWQCLGKRHRVLGTCIGFYEYVVMVALAVTLVVLLLQRNVQLMGVFAALIVAIYLW